MRHPQISRARATGRTTTLPPWAALPLTVLAAVIVVGFPQAAGGLLDASPYALATVGSIAAIPAGARSAAAPSDSTTINVDVALEPHNAVELAAYAKQISDPSSTLYKRYLTKAETQLLFAPSSAEVDRVTAALKATGLNPGAAIEDNLFIPVTSTIGEFKKAFRIGFAGYRLAGGRLAFNATSVPKIDGSVANDVHGVIGLDDFVKPKVDYQTAGTSGRSTPASATVANRSADNAVPAMCPSLTTAIDSYLAQHGYTGWDGGTYYSPTAMADVYGYSRLLESGVRGQGVTVAVEEWEAPDPGAIAAYESCVGSQSKVTYVAGDTGAQEQPSPTNFVGVETAIDIEAIASVAPRASIIDYEGRDAETATDADFLENFAAPVAADVANVISLSWTNCEDGPVNASFEDSETTTLQLAAVQGQSFFVASGDNGSQGCWSPDLHVSDPANNPWITAVGGTYMQGLANPIVAPWNDSFDASATYGLGLLDHGGATGGGVSGWQSFTSDWNYQAGFVGPGYSDACGATAGGACRQVPDLSALGDWRSGFPLIYRSDGAGYGVLMVAGTSLAAPIVAAMTALADSSGPCVANGPAGFVNPTIYDLARNATTYAANFHDETTGDNAYTPSGYLGSLYPAAEGYDMASGLGSPQAQNLIPSLCAKNKAVDGWSSGRSRLGMAAAHGQ